MLRGVFVTGTDTNVGKTAVSAALLIRYRAAAPLRYWKPVQTGIEQDDDTAEVARLAGCPPGEILNCGVRLPRPVSPHLAAQSSGRTISLASLLDVVSAEGADTRWIVEGAGGVLVPLNDDELMIDLMTRLELPVLVAARSGLGTINHTLLTIEALRRRSLQIAGVVMVGPPDADNRRAIERYGGVPVLGEMPRLDPLTPPALAGWAAAFDVAGQLADVLR